MKRPVGTDYNYTFTPSQNKLDLYGIPNFDVTRLFAVTDPQAAATGGNGVLYAPGYPGFGYSSKAGTVLTLQASMSGALPTDKLVILYDDGNSPAVVAAQIVQIAVAGALASSTNRLPVEVDGQSAGLGLDTSLQVLINLVGTLGSGTPTLPGTSTGLLGVVRYLITQLAGILAVGGGAAAGAAASGNPVLAGGTDGTNVRAVRTDALGILVTGVGNVSSLNISTATVVKASPGRVGRISVLTAGSGGGTVNDTTSTGAAASVNTVYAIPNVVGMYTLEWPCLAGIVIIPGSGGQVLSVSYT